MEGDTFNPCLHEKETDDKQRQYYTLEAEKETFGSKKITFSGEVRDAFLRKGGLNGDLKNEKNLAI